MNESSAISVFNIDTNLLSGSNDLFRNALGMSWITLDASLDFDSSTEAGKVLFWPALAISPVLHSDYYSKFTWATQGAYTNFYTPGSMIADVDSLMSGGFWPHEKKNKFAVMDKVAILSSSSDTFVPNYKFAMRIISNENNFNDDEEWLTYLKGGSYYTSSYAGIYSPSTFDVYNFKNLAPYSKLDAKNIDPANYSGYSTYNIQANYNHYYPSYESKITTLDSNLLLPNIYLLDIMNGYYSEMTALSDREIKQLMGPQLLDFIGMGTDPSEIRSLMQGTDTDYLPPYAIEEKDMGSYLEQGDLTYYDRSLRFRNFLTGTFVSNVYDSNVEQYAKEKFKNIFFTDAAVQNHYNPTQLRQNVLDRMPAYISIEVPRNNPGSITDIVRDHNFENMFISILRAEFESGLVQQQQMTAQVKSEGINQYGAKMGKTTARSTSYRSADLFDMLLRAYSKTTKPLPQDEFYVEPQGTFTALTLKNENGAYRYAHSFPILRFMKSCLSNIEKNGISSFSTNDELNCPRLEVGDVAYHSRKFWQMGQSEWSEPATEASFAGTEVAVSDYDVGSEAVAYRIEKLASNGDVIQNIYYFNDHTLGFDVSYYDSQVAPGVSYTYNVYEYRIVRGYKYKYSDLRPTRLLANETITEFAFDSLSPLVAVPSNAPAEYCLEFYDPDTLLAVPHLAPLSSGDYGGLGVGDDDNGMVSLLDAETRKYMRLDPSSTSVERLFGTYSTNRAATPAQVVSDFRYAADFYVHAEPTIKIIEVPYASKTLQVMDHPAVAPDVTPYQKMDDSQIIGFYIAREAPIPMPYPTPLNSSEDAMRFQYLNAYNLLPNENIDNNSVSKPRYLEIYRIDKRPNAISDFDGSLIQTKDLQIQNYDQIHNCCFYEEKVATNKKYYYLFRYLNENGVPGRWSPIQVAELINDGGYKYAEFDVIYEDSFKVFKDLETTHPFKKIFTAPPAVGQFLFNTERADFNQPAHSQYDNVQVGTVQNKIWDNTYKIRLTSKKTGNKIDLNVTYRLREDD